MSPQKTHSFILIPSHNSHPSQSPRVSSQKSPLCATPSAAPFQLVPLRGFGGIPTAPTIPTAPIPSLPVRLAPPSEFLRVSPSFSSKKYSTHYQHIIKNFQKKLRKNLQDKKNAVPLHPQMRQNTVSKQETTRTLT